MTPRTRKCMGCNSTEKPQLAYQVTSCPQCATFMQGIINSGVQNMRCNNRGAEHRLLSTPAHNFIDRKPRPHCNRHRIIQLLTKGFNAPTIENIAIGGNEHLHKEMRKALFIGSVKVAGEKYGFHKTQSSSSINSITKELNLTEDCCDLKQMVGSLAQLQEEQPPPTPDKPTLVRHIQPRPSNHSYNQGRLTTATNSTMLMYQGITPTGRQAYTIHKSLGKIVSGKSPEKVREDTSSGKPLLKKGVPY